MNPFNIKLDNWQKEIIGYDGNTLLCTGRQVGKTLTMSRKAAKYMLEHRNARIIVVSLTEDQAKLIIIMILDYLEKHHNKQICTGTKRPTQNKIQLKNGSQVLARPVGTTGDAVRGFTGDVLIIDEASRMPELAFTAAKPTLLTTAGQIWMCSTPFGKKGYFYESFLNKDNRFKSWHISSEKVIQDRPITIGWTEDKREKAIQFLASEKRDMSELQYGQEYLGLFLEELRQYFPDELLHKVCILDRPVPYPKHDNYIGVDIARMGGDECAYEILHNRGENKAIHHIENITKTKQLTTQTEQDILTLNTTFNLSKIGIDAGSGSLGVGIYDRLADRSSPIRNKVIAMNNRQIVIDRKKDQKQRIFKEDMYENLLAMMEKGEIALLNLDNVFASLKSVQWELKEKGSITKVRIFGNYTHIAEGLVRAAWLVKKEKSLNLHIHYI